MFGGVVNQRANTRGKWITSKRRYGDVGLVSEEEHGESARFGQCVACQIYFKSGERRVQCSFYIEKGD